MCRGFFGDSFDFDHNGELDSREQLLDFMAFEKMAKEEDGDEDDDEIVDLDMLGLDYAELSMMDEDERRETLEDAGLDPDKCDFYFHLY